MKFQIQGSDRRRVPRRKAWGVAILELTIAMFLVAILMGLLVQLMVTAGRFANNQQASMSLQLGSQHNLDVLAQDVQGADLILSTYTNGATTYTADTTTTLILRTPSMNATSTGTTATSDHIIYRIVATTVGAATGPYTLNRTVVPASGSGRAAVSNAVVATNIQSASFTYLGAQTQTQATAGTRTFTLLNGAAYAVPTGSAALQQAVVQGSDLCAGSSTCYSGSSVNLPTAPTTSAVIDFRFTVSPSVAVSSTTLTAVGVTCASGEAASYAKEVIMTLQLVAAAGNGNSQGSSPPTMTLTTTAAARNKAVF